MGWDEAFVGAATDDPEGLARRIREAVRTQTRLTCCVGIGDNLLRAKIATEFAKPPVRSESGVPAGTGVFTLTATDAAAIEAAVLEVLERFTARRAVRLVGVRAEFATDAENPVDRRSGRRPPSPS